MLPCFPLVFISLGHLSLPRQLSACLSWSAATGLNVIPPSISKEEERYQPSQQPFIAPYRMISFRLLPSIAQQTTREACIGKELLVSIRNNKVYFCFRSHRRGKTS
ncbi:hypothetical protein VTL71DRAFT_13016 [Oculimacula yallundae]|uniref:Secreted protein n=1 Tax=Oculimacula yallundae TaxID=86028 RepID=A0ABR4CQW8_9HELO